MPRSNATAESDRKYYEANREAILTRKRLNGKNYRDHKKENETPELRLQRLSREKALRTNRNHSHNRAKVTEEEAKTLPLTCYCLSPKAFDKLLAATRQGLAKNVITLVDGGGDAHTVL
jgi:hypothetical protein